MASCHHEHLDGSGYHKGLTAQTMSHGSRLIAAADTMHALTEPRAHRAALGPEDAAKIVVTKANSGLLDPIMVRAVVEASGEPPPEVEHPAGLTDREIEVVGLLSRGLQTKQIARHFDVSPKTVDTHIQAAYRKIGVSTRAAATLYAMEHGLIASREFPVLSRDISS
jgi:DNA-binding NarL/FixJ family response regulator